MNRFYKKINVWFTLPAVALFIIVVLIPFFMGLVYSFTSWRGAYFAGGSLSESFIGLDNYKKVFTNTKFLASLIYTVKFTVVAVLIINMAALALALLTNHILKGAGAFRTVFFLPNLLGGLALGYIWKFIFDVIFSRLLFGKDGVLPIEALTYMTQNNTKAIFALLLLTMWQWAGYMMLIYVNGLNNIPNELYEAAEIDGATAIQRFRYITLPMLMPSVTIVLFLLLANCFKLLDQNVALTEGAFSTRMLAMQIMNTPKDALPPDYGYAQAEAVVFFVLVAAVTMIQVAVTKSKEVEA